MLQTPLWMEMVAEAAQHAEGGFPFPSVVLASFQARPHTGVGMAVALTIVSLVQRSAPCPELLRCPVPRARCSHRPGPICLPRGGAYSAAGNCTGCGWDGVAAAYDGHQMLD